MASWHNLLLLFTTLASSSFDVTRKDHGDYFIWYGNGTITCEEFSRHTASYDSGSSRCKCKFPLTFSTQTSTCESFTDRVYYKLDRSNSDIDTSVSTVYGVCGINNYCALKSTVTNAELRVTKLLGNEPLKSNSKCVVNFVEILHDCIPTHVPLKLSFDSHLFDRKLYLKLHRTSTPLKNLEGELFLLDITCTADGAYNKKMMFKYSGTRHLDQPGSFSNVSAYDPAKTCPGVTTTTTHSVLLDSTGAPNHAHWSNSRDIAIEVGVPLTVLTILITVVTISCVIYRRHKQPYKKHDNDQEPLVNNKEQSDGKTDHDQEEYEF